MWWRRERCDKTIFNTFFCYSLQLVHLYPKEQCAAMDDDASEGFFWALDADRQKVAALAHEAYLVLVTEHRGFASAPYVLQLHSLGKCVLQHCPIRHVSPVHLRSQWSLHGLCSTCTTHHDCVRSVWQDSPAGGDRKAVRDA